MMPTLGNYASNPTIYLDDNAYLVDDDITLAVYLDDNATVAPSHHTPPSTHMLLCLLLHLLHLSTVPTCLILLANAGAYSLALPSLSEG